jgi:serine/alanine adding enzyme
MNHFKVRIAEAEDQEIWNKFILSHERSTYAHVFEWSKIINRAYGYEFKNFIFYDAEGIVGILPLIQALSILNRKSWVSLPFANYGGPLSRNEEDLEYINRYIQEQLVQVIKFPIEIKQLGNAIDFENKVRVVTSRLFLSSEDKLWNGFKPKVRNQIRKSLKYNFRVEKDIGHMDMFYNKVFVRSMKRLGTPHHSIKYFKEIINNYPGERNLITIWKDDTIVAGMFYVIHNNVFYDLVANSLREYNHLCPNHLLYWDAMRTAINSKCNRFDFGRSTIDTGVFKFKQQWGPDVYPIYNTLIFKSGEIIRDRNSYESGFYKISSRFWQKAPSIFTNSVGPLFRRYLP